MVGNNSNLEIFNRIKETNSNNADEYSNSKTYVKDEYCIYNNTLYKANQAIDTAEEFTESHWTETTVGTELKSQADSISALNSRTEELEARTGNFSANPDTVNLQSKINIIPCNSIIFTTSGFSTTSDGGIRCLKSGRIFFRGSFIANVTEGDKVIIAAGRYAGGWVSATYQYAYGGAGTKVSAILPDQTLSVNANDILYLRGYNANGARGTIDQSCARLYVEYAPS